jgi:hypothetical protein
MSPSNDEFGDLDTSLNQERDQQLALLRHEYERLDEKRRASFREWV